MRQRAFGLVVLLSSLGWSCFEIDQEIELKKDLSGTAKIGMKIDMEPMVLVMAGMQRAFGGKEGAPTKAELAAVKKKLLADQKSKMSKKELKQEKARLQEGMPKGVELTKLNANIQGMRMSYDVRLAFDDVTKLTDMRLDQKEAAASGQQNPLDRPFEQLRVVDEGKTLLIQSRPANPSAGTEESMKTQVDGDDPTGMGQAVKAALEKMKVKVKMTVPFKVLDSNATKTKGKTLTWTYDLEALEALASAKDPDGMWVRIEKPQGVSFEHLANLHQKGGVAPAPEKAMDTTVEQPAPAAMP